MFTLKSHPTDDPARHKAPGSGALTRWQKKQLPTYCFLRHQYVLRIVLFQRSIQPDPRKKKSNPIRAQNSATVVFENAITSQRSPSSLPRRLLGSPCSPRRSCPRRQQLAYCGGRCTCTGSQDSCYWAWETAPGEQEEAAQCCCFYHLRAVRWLSTRHHRGQSDLYC